MSRARTGGSDSDGEDRPTTFDVRVWSIREVRLKNGSSWQVRWQVVGRASANTRNFRSLSAAQSRHAEIFTAVKKGEAFDVESGLPVSEWRARPQAAPAPVPAGTWLAVAREYVDAKWTEQQAPGTRRSRAEALGAITPALFDASPPEALAKLVREALSGWVFVTGARTSVRADGRRVENEPPAGWVEVLDWMERHSRPISDLADVEVARAALMALSRRMDGAYASANTVTRRRLVFRQVIRFAVARGDLDADPVPAAQWTPPRKTAVVDRRVVVDHSRALRLLAAVGEDVPQLRAFFACIYYAAIRPGETQELNINQLDLPGTGWGQVTLEANNPEVSPRWSDTPNGPRRARELKHREKGEVRPVPLHPELVAVLRRHIDEHGLAPDGRLFRSRTGGAVKTARYLAVWRAARRRALTPTEVASPLARRPYDLRHAAVSRWLNAGVPPTQIAEWAGHSVRVLLTIYAKCIVGQETRALRLIDDSFAAERTDSRGPNTATPAGRAASSVHDRVHALSTDSRKPPDIAGPSQTSADVIPELDAAPPDVDVGL